MYENDIKIIAKHRRASSGLKQFGPGEYTTLIVGTPRFLTTQSRERFAYEWPIRPELFPVSVA